MIRDITGAAWILDLLSTTLGSNGAFISDAAGTHTSTAQLVNASHALPRISLQASRVVPTGATNKPRAWGALACCYLGTPVA